MKLHEKAVKGVLWSGIQNWGTSLTAALVLFVLARYVPKEDFGLFGIALAFILFSELVLRQGFAQALVQRPALDPEHLDTAFWVAITFSLLVSTGFALAATQVAALYGEPELAPVLRWLTICLFTGSLGYTHEAILRRNLAFKTLAIRQLIATFCGGLVGIIMAALGYGIWSLVGQVLTTSVVGATVLWLACAWTPCFRFSRIHLAQLWSFGALVTGVNLLSFVAQRADLLLIGYFLGTGPAGIYFIAFRLLTAVTQAFTQTVASVALPTFSRIQHDKQQLQYAFDAAAPLMSLVTSPVFFGLAAVAPELVPRLFGDGWEASVPIVQILAMSGCVQALFHFAGPVLLSRGRAAARFSLALLNAAVQIVAIMIAMRWGLVAVAAAGLIRAMVMYPVFMFAVRRFVTIYVGASVRQTLVPVILAVPMVLVVLGVKRLMAGTLPETAALGALIAIGIVVYSLCVFVLARPLADQALRLVRVALLPVNRNEPTEERRL